MGINFVQRVRFASLYLEALQKTLQVGWNEIYNQKENLKLYQKLTLIHPDVLSEVGLTENQINKFRGTNKFDRDNISTRKCASDKIWGYECNLTSNEQEIEQDHLFPYSLGGPTIKQNRIFLCRYHNQLKGNDIHLYPWEEEEANLKQNKI